MDWSFDEIINREGTDSVKYDLRQEIFGRNDIVPMWVADMDFKTPPFITKRLKNRLKHEILGYSFRPPEYFSSIARWLHDRHNWNIEKEWICFSPGIVPALNLCTLAFTRPGDSVIVQPPVYFPFFSAVENHGRELIYNKLIIRDNKWTMDFKGLLSSITEKTKMIIISNPHNPVGRVWSESELKELAGICLENKIIILSDEIHCDLIMPGFTHRPVANISKEIADITVTCIAPSKTFNLAGLSTSSVIIPNPVLRKYFKKKIDDLHIGNGNIFGTEASIAAYSEGHEWVDALMDYIERNARFVTNYCNDFIPEIVPVKPEGTYMIWLDCKKIMTGTKELKDFFVKNAGVGLNEGSQFGPEGEGFMRMNLATSFQKVEEAMNKIGKAVAAIR